MGKGESMTVTIYLHGLPNQRKEVPLVRILPRKRQAVIRGIAGLERFRLEDGRKVSKDGMPTPWDFWRLDVSTLPKGEKP